VELDAIAEPELERIANQGGADLVVGMIDPLPAGEGACLPVELVRDALAAMPDIARAVVVCNNGSKNGATPAPVTSDPVPEHGPLTVLSYALAAPSPGETVQQGVVNAYRQVFAAGDKLGVRACVIVVSQSAVSQPQEVTRERIYRLLQPVLDLGFDLVAPRYTRHKMEGLLNRSLLSPLSRALYGQQLQNPMGPDFALSGKLLRQVPGLNPLAAIAAAAASGGFQICESQLGPRTQPSTDWANLSALLAEVLGPVFLEMEKQAPVWQSLRGSQTVPVFGSSELSSEDGQAVDVRQMIESFTLGAQNLLDIWGAVLPPATLFELRKLSRQVPDQFRMPDDLWARIVYDFALAHRLRMMSRDHLLRSITPLYLGWIASYALELQAAGPGEIDARIERLARAFETNKPYLVSRWRWPDRFSP
jgi:hypothetical protein